MSTAFFVRPSPIIGVIYGQIGHISEDGKHRWGIVEEFTSIYSMHIDNKGLIWLLTPQGPYVVYPELLQVQLR